MIFLDNQTNVQIDTSKLEEIVKYLNIMKDIELLVVNNDIIKNMNLEYRGIDKETDVLSFPLESVEQMPLGSIVISIDKVKEEANSFAHSIQKEFELLFIHGLLHLIGYNHEVDSGQMRAKEREIIEHFNLPKSLIVRVEGE